MGTSLDVLVIIVNYRTAALTLRALELLERERANPALALEVIVVENASGDADVLQQGIAERFAHFATLVVSPVNGGFGAGNNLGIRTAWARGSRARFVHFLNPDTEVREGAVLSLARFLDENSRAGVAGGSFEFQDGTPWCMAFRFPSALTELVDGAKLRLLTRLFPDAHVARQLGDAPTQVDWPSGASMMMRREALEAVGGFDEAFFLYFEEIDLCQRVRDAGYTCWYVPQSRVMHVCGQSTGVTEVTERPRRLPKYWFESRRRYFAKHHGFSYTALADAAFLVGNAIGSAKDLVRRVPRTPYLFRDFVAESAILPRNRAALERERSTL